MHAPAPTHLYYDDTTTLVRLAWHEPLPGSTLPEAVVQHLWQEQFLNAETLRTVGGERVEVLHPGVLNHDSGPDFRYARLRIGETVWFGDIEVHTTSRGWRDHGHAENPAYNSVVLHVVLQPDLWTGNLRRHDHSILPELVLAPHLDRAFEDRLLHFFTRVAAPRPCSWGFADLPATRLHDWLRHCAAQRLERRAARYLHAPDFRTAVYEELAACLGYRPNAAPMRRLAARATLSDLLILRTPRDREALLFGMAGLLPPADASLDAYDEATRAYLRDLLPRFEMLRPCTPAPLVPTEWQYSRLRPANFPDIRIAQLAALASPGGILSVEHLENHLGDIEAASRVGIAFEALLNPLLDARPDPFWQHHYRLGTLSAMHDTRLGQATQWRLLVNVLLPAALALGGSTVALRDTILDSMARLSPEDDRLTRSFNFPPGWRPSLLDTQGLHELDGTYCKAHQCLSCEVGRTMLHAGAVSSNPNRPTSTSCSSGSSISISGPKL